MNLNKRIKKLREELKMTQKEFAERISISQSYLANIESGARTEVSDKVIKIICAEFGVNESWLKEKKGDMFVSYEDYFYFYLGYKTDSLSDFDKKFLHTYLSAPDEVKKAIKAFIESLVKSNNRDM